MSGLGMRYTVRGWVLATAVIGGSALLGAQGGWWDEPLRRMNPNVHRVGDPAAGRDVFRFETFGNERFWTDAARLPEGILQRDVTPLQALELGLNIDSEALPSDLANALVAELATDRSTTQAPLLNSVTTTVALINANAVIGMVAKDTDGDGTVDIEAGDKVGVSCALCHTITDASVLGTPRGGSIGRRQDGRAPHTLDVGRIFATAANSRALYPLLQLALDANGGQTLGRAATGLTEISPEAEVDAYLSNPDFYPVGMFDDTFDGNGDPMHNSALFRTDLAAPWGTDGTIQFLDNFSNLVYTGLLDPTTLTTPGGRAFLRLLGGDAAGTEIADDYVDVLAATGVTGYPYVQAAAHPQPGSEAAPLGIRVDDRKLVDMNGYLNSLQAPRGTRGDDHHIAAGRELFRERCTSCHNVNQAQFVPPTIVPMRRIFPGDRPEVLLPSRTPPLNPIVNTPDDVFDDKMAVVNASLRGLPRGTALPLLLDLARKPNFLHDNSVPSLNALLNPARGNKAPHPFYVANRSARRSLVDFLENLDIRPAR